MYAANNSTQDNNTLYTLDKHVNSHSVSSKRHVEKQGAEFAERVPMLHCANCDIDILWTPTIVQGKAYCCTGCAAGGPCNCDYSQLPYEA